MAILYNKGLGKNDNITYLMQKTNKGSKKRSRAEMQEIANEQNRQNQIMRKFDPTTDKILAGGINTLVKVWPENEEFNPEFMDSNDAIAVIGDKAAEEGYIRSTFPESSSPIINWSKTPGSRIGLAKNRNSSMDNDAIEQWGVVDSNAAHNYGNAVSKLGGITQLQYLGLLMNHESGGHTVKGDGHTARGIMKDGVSTVEGLEKGLFTLDDILAPKNNVAIVNQTIEHRQFGDANRMPVDNYAKNKAKYEKRMKDKMDKFEAAQEGFNTPRSSLRPLQ